MAKRGTFSDEFKAKIALEALRGDKTIQETAAKYQVRQNQVSTWYRQAVEGMADVFARGGQSMRIKYKIFRTFSG
ncbi:transposase [Labrenzia sp. OB1]|uniref:transposase n=1 Tax=Labrenzia sp. OB1 TaxID=1561204 RepID=UPI000838D6A0|nr:transposase [Labrenzia sp. OB1]